MSMEEKTFCNEDNLPSLIVPTLQETVSKYLDSCKAVLDDALYKETEEVCSKFLKSDVTAKLHQKLLERAQERRNWLEEWWLNKAYLELRFPLPLLSYSGPSSYAELNWPMKIGSQLYRSAWNIHIFYLFWDMVRNEKMAVHKTAQGKPLSMNQFRYLFNTYRRPRRDRDELLHFFKTSDKGLGPTHMIVMKRGYIFCMDGFDRNQNRIKPPEEIFAMLSRIEAVCDAKPKDGPSVGVLTTLDRNKWADVRGYLINHHQRNRQFIDLIEKSLFAFSLDDTNPTTYTEMCRDIAFGNWQNRWYDKSYTGVSFKNGTFATNCDHTPSDAMVMAVYSDFNVKMLAEFGDQPLNPAVKVKQYPQELDFVLDHALLEEIAEAKINAAAIQSSVDIVQPTFKNFGKKAFKTLRLHPDFAVQISLQLTYMQLHGKPAPTYETAMTRQYYHGRTETCRTCTPEVVQFCRSMLKSFDNSGANIELLQGLLDKAQDKYLWLMNECSKNKGCDRHLYALSLIAEEEGLPAPELFNHSSYTASGGKGNFTLSTSCLGYTNIQGLVAPMVVNGYGCFYRINDEKIVYSVTSYNSCADTSSQRFADHFEYNLNRVRSLKTSGKL